MKSRGLIFSAMGILAAVTFSSCDIALAHAKLKTSQPAANSKVQAGIKEIRLMFNETIEPSLSTVEVDGPDGRAIASSKGSKVCAKQTCKLAVPALAAGTYAVKFHVLSMDGHVVEGSYSFSTTE